MIHRYKKKFCWFSFWYLCHTLFPNLVQILSLDFTSKIIIAMCNALWWREGRQGSLPQGNYFHFSHFSWVESKRQQTKMLFMCQRFGDLFLFGLVWQYSSAQIFNKGRFKVMATYLQQWYNFETTFIHWLCFEERARFL